jgi:hypothetical protein
MQQVLARAVKGKGPIWLCDGIRRRIVPDHLVTSVQWLGSSAAIGPLWNSGAVWDGADLDAFGAPDLPAPAVALTADQVTQIAGLIATNLSTNATFLTAVANAVLDEDHARSSD